MEFEWTDFYAEFATKLLMFKDNRNLLIEKIKAVYKSLDMKIPKLDSDDDIIDIDPFTVIGLFNKGITKANRIAIIEQIAVEFDINAKVPQNFDGIPVLNNLSATFYAFKDDARRKPSDIDNLWNVLESAIKYADNYSEENCADFSKWYDAVLNQYGVLWNITMGLFWIRPYTFINLDSTNREYITNPENMPVDFTELIKKKINKVPSSEDYIFIKNACDKILSSGDYEYKNYPELSYISWMTSKSKNKKSDNVCTTHYWFLTANPKIWSLANMPVGEVEDYTLYNENGRKRRIYKNFLDAKTGDVIIGYETSPVKQIVALMRVYAEQDGEKLYFEKTENLSLPIDFTALRNCPELKNMEYFAKPQGSLFKLTKGEYECILNMIRDENSSPPKYTKEDFLNDVYMTEDKYDRLTEVLKKKKNIILQGAPGVGKTFIAKRIAYSMMGVKNDKFINMVQFHQSYSYEDFVMGFRPQSSGFELKNGIFYDFCKSAERDRNNDYFFIIDEINRGNLSKIFGELFMLIENDKRGMELPLLYKNEKFTVPDNVYIIGMMNTADRSLAMLDYALRRRFAFVEINPGFETNGFCRYKDNLKNEQFNKLIDCIKELNSDIAADESLGEGFCIGHSYFCDLKSDEVDKRCLNIIVEYEIIPLLKEYWFDEPIKFNVWSNKLRSAIK